MQGDISLKKFWKPRVCSPSSNFQKKRRGDQNWIGRMIVMERHRLFSLSLSLEVHAGEQIQGFQKLFREDISLY